MWKILGPFIHTEREKTGFRIHQIHFEYLAAEMSKVDIEEELLRKLGQPMPPEGWVEHQNPAPSDDPGWPG
jgi:hypothetical protein